MEFSVGNSERLGSVNFRGVELVSVNTKGGDDSILFNDTAAVTVVNTGTGDDTVTIGTVPTIPDKGNRTLEYPEGIPIADTSNMTNGNSNSLFVFGWDQNDAMDVNFNRAQIFLHGGAGDDRFVLKTFLVLKENTKDAEEVTNLANAFGGTGSNRYSYLEKGPAFINGGPGVDTLIVIGTAIADTFVVTENLVVGAGQIVNFVDIESVEINGAGGDDQIYVLSTSENFSLNIVGGSGDDTIHLGGNHPPMVFDPPAVEFIPPPVEVSLGEKIVYEKKTDNWGTYEFRFNFGWWSWWFGGSAIQRYAEQAVAHTVNGWFSHMKGNKPNMRNENHTYDSISSREHRKLRGWWWWWPVYERGSGDGDKSSTSL